MAHADRRAGPVAPVRPCARRPRCYTGRVRSFRALIATAFALFVMGAGVGDTLLQCRSKKTVHATCCCPHKLQQAPPHDGSALSRAPCCDATALETAALPPSTAASGTMLSLVAVTAPVLFEVQPPAFAAAASLDIEVRRLALDDTPRVPTGPPKPIRYRSLLI